MSDRHLEYLWIAAPQKRYENFIHRAADFEEVWMIGDAEGELQCEIDSCPCLCVWPEKDFAQRYQAENLPGSDCSVFSVELDTFLEQAEALPDEIAFAVFPTGDNDRITDKEQLLHDLDEELENY